MNIESELKMIATVIANQFIYDKSHPSYRNILIRNQFWNRLSNELCLDEMVCRQRYKSLRDNYVAESKRVAAARSVDKYSPKFRYYKELKFMFDCAAMAEPYMPIPPELKQQILFVCTKEDTGMPPISMVSKPEPVFLVQSIDEQSEQSNNDMLDLEIAIIEAVKSNSFLYNRKHKYYRKMKVRSQFWKQLSISLNCDEKLCRQKYKTLRDQYAMDAKRVKQYDEFNGLLNSGSKFRHFDRLSFLSNDTLVDESEPQFINIKKERDNDESDDDGNENLGNRSDCSSSSFNYDDQFDETLINAILDNPFLYDKTNHDFENSLVRCEFWRTFSKRIGVNEKLCRKRFQNLQENYETIVRQIKLGANNDEKYFMKHFEKLLFLSINELPDVYERIKGIAQQSQQNEFDEPDFDFMDCDSEELPLAMINQDSDNKNKMKNNKNNSFDEIIKKRPEKKSKSSAKLKQKHQKLEGTTTTIRSHYPSKVYEDDFEITLIDAIHDNPFMYDKSNSNYRNFTLRCQFWEQLSKHIGVKERICRTRFRSLRDKFALVTRRIKAGEIDRYSNSFRHFRKLLFLLINESIEDKTEIESKASLFDPTYNKTNSKTQSGKTKSTFTFEQIESSSTIHKKINKTESKTVNTPLAIPPSEFITIKNESIKIIEPEIEITSILNKPIKCGETFYMGNGIINYQCFLCGNSLANANLFTNHIIEHYANDSIDQKVKTTKTITLETQICKIENDKDFNADDDYCSIESMDNNKDDNISIESNDEENNIPILNKNKPPSSKSTLLWKCNECDERFVCCGQKDNHEAIFHDILQSAQCNWCTAWFPSDEEHTKHEELHAQMLDDKKNDLVTCSYCQQLFANQLEYEKHYLLAEKSKQLQQSKQHQTILEKSKKNPQKTENNLQKKTINNSITSSLPVKCELCDKTYSRRNISHHMRVTHSTKPEESVECKLCNQYYGREYIIRHFRSVHDPNKTDKKIQCPICDLIYLPKLFLAHYTEHLKIDAEKIKVLTLQLISCKLCKKIMHTNSYSEHLSSVHNKNKRIQCSICRKYVRSEYLRTHQIKYHESKPEERTKFECHVCKGQFTEISNLRIHMRIHTGERPYECPICKQTFRQTSNIKEHIRTMHTNERPFLCAECGKGFVAQRMLNYHMKIKHSGLPPPERLQCHLCSKTLKHNYSLQKHITTTHSTVRPFPCPVCSKAFKCKKTLSGHLKLHSDEKQYVCKYCGQRFAQVAGKRGHERRVHENSKT